MKKLHRAWRSGTFLRSQALSWVGAGMAPASGEPYQMQKAGMNLLYPHHLINTMDDLTAQRSDNTMPGRKKAAMSLNVSIAMLSSDRNWDQHGTKEELSIKNNTSGALLKWIHSCAAIPEKLPFVSHASKFWNVKMANKLWTGPRAMLCPKELSARISRK